jgi:anti-sigma factor RsiW
MSSNPCEWTLEYIEPYLDGEMDAGERAGFEAHCVVCASCARELSFAIRIRRELRSLPPLGAPERVVEAAAREVIESKIVPLTVARTRRNYALPALAAAIALVAAVWFGIHERRPEYSEAEIRRASAEMALAFRYVDRYSDGVVRDDVMEKRVVPHIERALREAGLDVTSPPPGRS